MSSSADRNDGTMTLMPWRSLRSRPGELRMILVNIWPRQNYIFYEKKVISLSLFLALLSLSPSPTSLSLNPPSYLGESHLLTPSLYFSPTARA